MVNRTMKNPILAGKHLWLAALASLVVTILLADLPGAVAAQPQARENEVRALWVVRNTLTSPARIHTMVESAAQAGFNTLIVQVRGRGDAYYRSRWEPRAIELNDQPLDFDPLAATISEAHQRGLKVHAWLNTSLLANLDSLPDNPKHVFNAHPEWLAAPRRPGAEQPAIQDAH